MCFFFLLLEAGLCFDPGRSLVGFPSVTRLGRTGGRPPGTGVFFFIVQLVQRVSKLGPTGPPSLEENYFF